jgi:16S rRNA G527 N7-methylase RsmG
MNMPERRAGISIADIGSGAGFPGIPLAIIRPLCKITLVEANQRKAVFLRESTRHIHNVRVEGRRAEALEQTYEWLVSRAVRHDEVLSLVPALGSSIGLLSTEDIFEKFATDRRFTWNTPVTIPWDPRRLCIYGRSST